MLKATVRLFVLPSWPSLKLSNQFVIAKKNTILSSMMKCKASKEEGLKFLCIEYTLKINNQS